MIRSILVGAVAALSIGLSACQPSTEGFSADDRAKVEARIAQLDAEISKGNLASALDVVPPRLLRTMAERTGASEADIKAAVREMVAAQMQSISIVSFDMDLKAAEPQKSADGTRTYLLIPTVTVMEAAGVGKVKTTTSTLALEDEGEWYLVRIDDQNQVAMVKELWPELAAVEFPNGVTERLQ
jgi:hypothetical protein